MTHPDLLSISGAMYSTVPQKVKLSSSSELSTNTAWRVRTGGSAEGMVSVELVAAELAAELIAA